MSCGPNCTAGSVGGDCSCMGQLPAAGAPYLSAPPAAGPAPTLSAPGGTPGYNAPMPTPLDGGKPAAAGPGVQLTPNPAYYGMVQNASYRPGYYPPAPYGYGYAPYGPMAYPGPYGYAGYNPGMMGMMPAGYGYGGYRGY